MPSAYLSIIIPVLDEAVAIGPCLERLQPYRAQGVEVIVVDGGSVDDTLALAQGGADHLMVCPPGRARQMNEGASRAKGVLLLFLHADTELPTVEALEDSGFIKQSSQSPKGWGFFNVRLSGSGYLYRVIEAAMNGRSRLTSVATGDQVIFVERRLFDRVGGFPSMSLMEDVALSKILRRAGGKPIDPGLSVVTSSRRWESRGIVRTVMQMWWLRLLYFLGVPPEALWRRYYG